MLILYTAQALVKQNCLALEAGMKAKQKQNKNNWNVLRAASIIFVKHNRN